ncbi:MAG: hypothetical protein PVH88_12405 [Ignavibacteria bacterium]|jgi:hypothetical protein
MSLKELCLNLAFANSEKEIIDILQQEGYWGNENNWSFFGNKENNWGDIGNQQSEADGALVEKLINSVDAVLMLENSIRKHTVKKYQKPNSIKEALEKFFNIYEGKLSNISAPERTALANKISLVATGTKSKPCYSIIDFGEGQSPAKMPTTLLSLGESNKLRVPFVQGKYNMGGTGILRFCGYNNFEFILSKRNPLIAQNDLDDTKDFWTFTITRRINPEKSVRSSIYKYLIIDKKIPSFQADSLPLLPNKFPDETGKNFYGGTFIKLYEYDIGSLKTLITLNMNYRLSLLLPQLALPIRLYERRKGFIANTYETTLSGLEVRLEEDKSNNIEEKYRASGEITVLGQKLKYSIFPFKKKKIENYTNNEGIIFTINGQTHGSLSKAFFKRKKVGLGYLADSLLVVADCSEFSGRSREYLFKNDRETLISCKLKREIERALEDELKNHKGLRLLQEERRREEIENKLEDAKPLADILKKSPTLSKLLLQGLRLSNPFKSKLADSKTNYEGKKFPTFFTLVKKYGLTNPKEAQHNKRFRIQYETDVANDYFERSKDPGTMELYLNDKKVENTGINCWNGFANLTVRLDLHKINEVLHFKSKVFDIQNSAIPFEEEFFVKVVPQSKNGNGNRKPPPGDKDGNENNMLDKLALPNIICVRKSDWEEHGFNEYSSVKVVSTGNNHYDFFINLDNIHLLTELKYCNPDEIELLEARYKYGMTLISIALLNEENNLNKDDDDIYDRISNFTQRISPVLLPMITSLGDLKIEEFEEASY